MMNFNNIQKIHRTRPEENHLFSLLIPSWNNLEYLKLCIRSIRQNSAFPHQIIVLINEGKDGSLSWIKEQPDIDYVYSPDNIGICYGLNVCRPLIHTDYIVYVNDDMYMLPGWDQNFLDEIQKLRHHWFMLSATMIEPQETNNICGLVKNYGDHPAAFQEELLLKEFKDLEKPDWSGSTWPPVLIPVKLWDLVGGMSIEFSPGMYSDPDLSMKLWKAGVRYFKGLGNSKVYHFGSKSTGRIRKNRGRDMFLRKYGITPNYFVKKFLKRGEPFSGNLTEPKIPWKDKLLHKFKTILLLFQND
ncbi:glycosyltransferase [Candidatus Sulfidibacterium hydrothermale]|uniref:glycosyltransferase family 2 protein n=1 Tax=Candidatus Sulfidibacterium hydrothermale TaxID=2875962 RepID=UPI001F0A2F86|nr:glycosyltransferase [Candidatus Sulfidibacterium hydrothermale]UBM63341.1 glycosyltransferase [Candidatus Sulfidibacterium hydrothermale]